MLAPVPLGRRAGSPAVPGKLHRPLGLSLNPRAGEEPEGAARVRCGGAGMCPQGGQQPAGRVAPKIQTKQKAASKDLCPLTVT